MKINTKEIVSDIRNGMKDSDLMKKYQIDSNNLDNLMKKLVKSGLLDASEINIPNKTEKNMADEKCPQCGNERNLKDISCSNCGIIFTKYSRVKYKMVQIPPTIEIKKEQGNEAAAYLQTIVTKNAVNGWEFYRVDEIGVQIKPGCLGVLFGSKVETEIYYVVTFRKTLSD